VAGETSLLAVFIFNFTKKDLKYAFLATLCDFDLTREEVV